MDITPMAITVMAITIVIGMDQDCIGATIMTMLLLTILGVAVIGVVPIIGAIVTTTDVIN